MQTKEDVESQFRAELQQLLDKYGADLEAGNHWEEYPCGQDVRMKVYIPSIWDSNDNLVREGVVFDLGQEVYSNKNKP